MKDFWNGLEPKTRRWFIAGVSGVLIASMYFGVFPLILEWLE